MTSQFVDIFTKGLPSSMFNEFRSSINIYSGDYWATFCVSIRPEPDP
jgi:hypothetical protein